ncbi:hypothetical protein [Candidatus Poriferisodalis sp.]|uniref:hypothetical protein n=1 Tax=Candidatus Poriferisodalis sp. TaxID=3101277 RepID=UPI003B52DBF5
MARIVSRRLVETWTVQALFAALGPTTWICSHEDAQSVTRWPGTLDKWFIIKPTTPERVASAGSQWRETGSIDSYIRIDLGTAAAHDAGFRDLNHPDVIYVMPDLSQWLSESWSTRSQTGVIPPAVEHFVKHSVAMGASRLMSQLQNGKGSDSARVQFHRGQLMYRPHATQDAVALETMPLWQLLSQLLECQEPAGLALRRTTRGQPRRNTDETDTVHTRDMTIGANNIDRAIKTVKHSPPELMLYVGQTLTKPRPGADARP